MSEQRINEYIEGKYGKLGVDRYASISAYIVIWCSLTMQFNCCYSNFESNGTHVTEFIYLLIGTCVQVYAIWTIYVANISQLPLDFSTFMRRNYDSHGSFDERAASFWAFTEARQNNAVNPSQLTL